MLAARLGRVCALLLAMGGISSGPVAAGTAVAWRSVGRLELGDSGFCTGALIAPDLVLTAGHCLWNRTTGEPVPAASMRFLVGFRGGRAIAYRRVRLALPHPDYAPGQRDGVERVSNDLAILVLDRPVPRTLAPALRLGSSAGIDESVEVVGYGESRQDAARPEHCGVLGRDALVQILGCRVEAGASGSPVLRESGGGPELVSVVSAAARWRDRPVALAADVGTRVAALVALARERLAARSGMPTATHALADRRGLGAKFVKVPGKP